MLKQRRRVIMVMMMIKLTEVKPIIVVTETMRILIIVTNILRR